MTENGTTVVLCGLTHIHGMLPVDKRHLLSTNHDVNSLGHHVDDVIGGYIPTIPTASPKCSYKQLT
jgi:hypothetical protein